MEVHLRAGWGFIQDPRPIEGVDIKCGDSDLHCAHPSLIQRNTSCGKDLAFSPVQGRSLIACSRGEHELGAQSRNRKQTPPFHLIKRYASLEVLHLRSSLSLQEDDWTLLILPFDRLAGCMQRPTPLPRKTNKLIGRLEYIPLSQFFVLQLDLHAAQPSGRLRLPSSGEGVPSIRPHNSSIGHMDTGVYFRLLTTLHRKTRRHRHSIQHIHI
jgi:hypothetical protein